MWALTSILGLCATVWTVTMSILGALAALHRPRHKGEPRRGVRITEPGLARAEPVITTAPYPMRIRATLAVR
jgi:hypothetical protein